MKADLFKPTYKSVPEAIEYFIVREKRLRKGRNPKTGEELAISARRVSTFKPSLVLRKALNEGASSSSKFGVSEEGSIEIENL